MHDVAAMREHWRRNGPPLNIATVAIAASLGVDLIDRDAPPPVMPDQRPAAPSIEELMRLTEVRPGCDPMAASRIIAQALERPD